MHRREEKVRSKLGDFFFSLATFFDPEPNELPEPVSAPSNVVPIGSAHHPSRR